MNNEDKEKTYGIEEIYFFNGYDIPSVYTVLLGWDSLVSFENLKNQLIIQFLKENGIIMTYLNSYLQI